MNEIQQTVDELRFILQRDFVEKSDELIELVRRYSQHCHDVNVRLRRCDAFVKQGLKAEAIHLADSSPVLLDSFAILDFPERQQLLDVVSLYFLEPPEPLLVDVATALNETYAEHAPLQNLLDRHRLLALGRAPLNQRLEMLRSLAELDPGSTFWDDDLREMERARFRQMEGESIEASKSANGATLRRLVEEIQSTDWREDVPESLVRNIKGRTAQDVRNKAREQLRSLSDSLFSAFSELDAKQGRLLRDKWNQQRPMAALNPSDPLIEGVQPVLDWLESEDREAADARGFAGVLAQIERLLDSDETTVDELRKAKGSADRYQRAWPSLLESRYRSRLSVLETVDRRRRTVKLAAIAGCVALVIGIGGFVFYISAQGEKTRRLVAAISAYLDDGKLAEAKKLIDENSDRGTSESWLEVKRKYSNAEQAEADRVVEWKSEVAKLRDQSDPVVITAALKRARELSKTTDEKLEVGELQSTWQKRLNEITSQRETTVRAAISKVTASLKTLDDRLGVSDGFDRDQLQPLLDEVSQQLSKLLQERDVVSKELGSQITLLENRWKASHRTLLDLTRKQELLSKITDAALLIPGTPGAAANVGRYEAALSDYVTALPNDPRSAMITAAAESSPLAAVLAGQKLLESWKRVQPGDRKDLEERLRALRAFATDFPQAPDRERFEIYEKALAAMLRRYEEDGDPDEGVQRRMYALFNGKFIKDGDILQDDDGNTYYLPNERTEPFGNVVSFSYLTGFNGETKKDTLKSSSKLLTPTSVSPPQKELADFVRSTIRNVPLDGWRDYIRDLVERLVKTEQIDAYLRYVLVLKTLEFAGRGDYWLELELAPLIESFRDDQIDRSVAWIDPKSKAANEARRLAQIRISKIAPLGGAFERAKARQDEFERYLFAQNYAFGWLDKSPRGRWMVRTAWRPEGSKWMYVVQRPDVKGVRRWEQLGRVKDGEFVVEPQVAQSVGEMSLVFASSNPLSIPAAK